MKRLYIFFLVIFLSINASHADILMAPYLMDVTAHSVYVMVETNTSDSVLVEYGTTPDFGLKAKTTFFKTTNISPVTYVHRIVLTGLEANTRFYYQVTQGKTTSNTASFVTAVTPGTPFRFAWLADVRTGNTVHDQLAQNIMLHNPAFSVYGGDYCTSGTYNSWKNDFFRQPELDLIARVPMMATIGNHEKWYSLSQAFLQMPVNSSRTQDYFSFDYGDMHVLVLNNMVNYAPESRQYEFAMHDLATTDKNWKIVVSHIPPYCSGSHGEDDNMKIMAEKVFLPNGVDAVISGHAHFYQHNLVQNTHYLVIGGGGAPLAEPTTAPYTKKSIQDYCFGIIDVSPDQFNIRVYNAQNTLIDSVFLTRPATETANATGACSELKVYNDLFLQEVAISFNLKKSEDVRLSILNFDGNEVCVLQKGILGTGHFEYNWNTEAYTSGLYFVNLRKGDQLITRKFMVVK